MDKAERPELKPRSMAGVGFKIGDMGLQTPAGELPRLFQPLRLRGVTLKNRVMLPPMSQYLSVLGKGVPTDWQLVHLGQFAMGGTALIFCEETAVEERGRRTHNCAGIYSDEQVKAWRRITDFMRDLGSVPGIQLGHSGSRACVRSPWEGRAPLTDADAAEGRPYWQTVSASAVEGRDGRLAEALDVAGIGKVIDSYVEATRRSMDAGFEAIEIHGAHGYLISQFLSPSVNRRTDGYGGSLEGRMRFAFEVTEAVRAAWPADKPLFFRVSAVDGAGLAWDIDDALALARGLKQRGVDVIDAVAGSGGELIRGQRVAAFPVPRVPGFHVPYAEHISRETGTPGIASGNIVDARHAEAILAAGQADLIAIGREMLCDPYWTAHAARELGVKDWLSLLPPTYVVRLRERDDEYRRWPADRPHPVPFRRPDKQSA
jgi:2,4-dienoyl-CoA reductase-like NADH-dependent reductase (Old Yellow Enzyme family)